MAKQFSISPPPSRDDVLAAILALSVRSWEKREQQNPGKNGSRPTLEEIDKQFKGMSAEQIIMAAATIGRDGKPRLTEIPNEGELLSEREANRVFMLLEEIEEVTKGKVKPQVVVKGEPQQYIDKIAVPREKQPGSETAPGAPPADDKQNPTAPTAPKPGSQMPYDNYKWSEVGQVTLAPNVKPEDAKGLAAPRVRMDLNTGKPTELETEIVKDENGKPELDDKGKPKTVTYNGSFDNLNVFQWALNGRQYLQQYLPVTDKGEFGPEQLEQVRQKLGLGKDVAPKDVLRKFFDVMDAAYLGRAAAPAAPAQQPQGDDKDQPKAPSSTPAVPPPPPGQGQER